jgi:type III secretion protein S
MQYDVLVGMTSEALLLCLLLSLPAVGISALVGLLVSFFQAVTSLQDSSISQGIKLFAVGVVAFVAAPWAGATLMRFSESVFTVLFER